MPTRTLLICAVAVLATGCRAREVEKDLKLTDVRTGWYDVGIVDGQNKLVPSVSFKIRNISQDDIKNVQFNAVFRRVDTPEQSWGDNLVRAIGADGLAAGATGGTIVMRSPLGYTSSEPRLTMLEHTQFVDATVQIFGRHRSRPWARVGDFKIERQLLTE